MYDGNSEGIGKLPVLSPCGLIKRWKNAANEIKF
jgi:hypothetical protein